jgi:hypothetical protein
MDFPPDSPIVLEFTEIYRGEFPRKLMSCWRPYCAVGVPADVITVVG